jgi:TonB family protein
VTRYVPGTSCSRRRLFQHPALDVLGRCAVTICVVALLAIGAAFAGCEKGESSDDSSPSTASSGGSPPVRWPNTPGPQGDFAPPQLVHQVRPHLPPAVPDTVTPVVLVMIDVDTTGHVDPLYVVKGDSVLRQAALDAVAQWQFVPAGTPDEIIPARIVVPVRFDVGQPN